MSTTSDILLQELLQKVTRLEQGLGLNPVPATKDNGVWSVEKYDNYFLKKQAKRRLKNKK